MITTVYSKSVMVYGSLQVRVIGTHRNARRFGLRVNFLGSGHLQPYRLAFHFLSATTRGVRIIPSFRNWVWFVSNILRNFTSFSLDLPYHNSPFPRGFPHVLCCPFNLSLLLSVWFVMALYGFIELFKFRYTVNWYRVAIDNDYST